MLEACATAVCLLLTSISSARVLRVRRQRLFWKAERRCAISVIIPFDCFSDHVARYAQMQEEYGLSAARLAQRIGETLEAGDEAGACHRCERPFGTRCCRVCLTRDMRCTPSQRMRRVLPSRPARKALDGPTCVTALSAASVGTCASRSPLCISHGIRRMLVFATRRQTWTGSLSASICCGPFMTAAENGFIRRYKLGIRRPQRAYGGDRRRAARFHVCGRV